MTNDYYKMEECASNQARYPDDFRPNTYEEKSYSRGSPNRDQRWQERNTFLTRNVDDRNDVKVMQKYDFPRVTEQRVLEQIEKSGSRARESRSPRRDRSPLRDRSRRHSPSPRSPRRSWALEKRRSPEVEVAPPPPLWPKNKQTAGYERHDPPQSSERSNDKLMPIWERKQEDLREPGRHRDEQRNLASRQSHDNWKPAPHPTRVIPPRFEETNLMQVQRDLNYRKKHLEDHGDIRKVELERNFTEDSRQDYEERKNKQQFSNKRSDYSTFELENKDKELLWKQEKLQKEIVDVYERAVEFAKKTDDYRKSERVDGSQFTGNRRDNERFRDEPLYSRSEELRSTRDEPKIPPKEPEWKIEHLKRKHVLDSVAKEKRDRAVAEISETIISKYGSDLVGEMKSRVCEELKVSLSRKLFDMFGDVDVSFIELVVKYNAKYNSKDEKQIFDEVMASFPIYYRNMKSSAEDDNDVMQNRNPDVSNFNNHQFPVANLAQTWNLIPTNAVIPAVSPIGVAVVNQPVMVPVPNQYQFVQPIPENPQPLVKERDYNLYLCKDDFTPFTDDEATCIKNFLVEQLLEVTETIEGWAPDFTLNKQVSVNRYEVVTRDKQSKDWLLSLDFSEFKKFNVLVYTTEELWYERAAIWLPGHSKYRNIEPLEKLALQNKQMKGVSVGKWKFVKKIITEKGTRIYVDIPPSSARALEKYKMTLSYELQKVNVFLKAVAVDKAVFESGLNEPSLMKAPDPESVPMPSITPGPDVIKISLKGNKPLSVAIARKIKDMVIYQLFKYLQRNGNRRTDFVRYGFCLPGYLGVIPENEESRKWLCSIDIGKLNRQAVVIMGIQNKNIQYIRMFVELPNDYVGNGILALERLKHSNQGLKGVNFHLWRNAKIFKRFDTKLEIEMDIESIETLSKMKYQIDYVDCDLFQTVTVTAEQSYSELEKLIAKYKSELNDSYVVANMEISSSDDDDVICYD